MAMVAIMEIVVTAFALALAATCTVAVVLEKMKRDRAAARDDGEQRVTRVVETD
ncbi:MAG: hypothetical protein HKN81_02140 [Gammaproteobacteria bacterium]|nr:hypothetical protein [Gammaproteobacteria bacterium]NND35910.1 hypothetical protein [Gammaproteobacteria bacterium]